LIITDTTLEIV